MNSDKRDKQQRIKILYIISNVDIGGAEVLLLNICRGLLTYENKFDIRVLTYFDGNALKPDFEKIGVSVDCLNIPKISTLSNIIRKINLTFKYIKKFKPDIVHTQLLDTDRYGQIAAFLAGVRKRICTVHNIEQYESNGFKITRKITSILATQIIFVAKCAMNHYCSIGAYPASKSMVINNAPGFIDNKFEIKEWNPGKPICRLINVGRLHTQKGQLYLIRAMKLLEKSPTKFELNIFGGDYLGYRSELESEIQQLNLQNVYFKGNSTKIINEYRNSDIFISSSLYEAAPLVILEAITAGIPIIATDIPPHREILGAIQNYDLFVPTKDPVLISETILNLVNNPEKYKEISKNSLIRAQDYSHSKLTHNYMELYL